VAGVTVAVGLAGAVLDEDVTPAPAQLNVGVAGDDDEPRAAPRMADPGTDAVASQHPPRPCVAEELAAEVFRQRLPDRHEVVGVVRERGEEVNGRRRPAPARTTAAAPPTC